MAALKPRMDALEARRATLQRDMAVGGGGAPIRLHEGIAEIYQAHVASLRDALARNAGPEVLEAARALIDRVVVHPAERPRGPRKVELFGQLSALLRAAGALPAEGRTNADSPLALASGLDVFACSESWDAGTRIGLCRTVLRGRERR